MSTAAGARALPTTPDTDTLLAKACKAAADPLRLQILRTLKSDSFGVLELSQITGLAQSKLSHHLKVLASANLVASRREGNSIFYRRPLRVLDDPLGDFLQSLFAAIDSQMLDAPTRQRMARIKAERSQSSLDFFAKNAGKFSEVQELITESSHYVSHADELIALTGLPASACAIEIGPGEGHYLATLSQRFNTVIAIDNSAEMLELARQQSTRQARDNIRFILGEPDAAIVQGLSGELVVCHMVLHHVPSPAVIFDQAAQLLAPQGYLLVSELCPHDQEWVKGSCGDLWLGFEPEELKHWAGDAGLAAVQDLFLGLRNGFQIQLHLFKKLPTQGNTTL